MSDQLSTPTVSIPPLPAQTPIGELAEMLAAMANSEGGTLRLRLETLTLDEALDRVREAALKIDPILLLPTPQPGDAHTLTITVPRGLPRVFALEGRYLIRDSGVNRPLAPRELRRLLIERGDLSYEEEPVHGATQGDLDWAKAEAYAASVRIGSESAQEVLVRRGCLCLTRQAGQLMPTNAGLLLFGKDPQRVIRGAAITAVRFAGIAMSDVFTRQDISGTLPDQIRRAETFLHDNLRRDIQMRDSMKRSEHLEYPMAAVRELIVNAVSHRDYSIHGDDIRLFIFADRLEVTSPGGLPGPVTVDNIAEERFSRNPAIVQVLSDMGFIERLGYGVDRVIALMKAHGLPAPQFNETGGGVRVWLLNDPMPVTSPANLPANLNSRQETALRSLNQQGRSRITNKDLQELFPDVHPETLRRDFADLVSKGLLIKLGQKRGSYYTLPPHKIAAPGKPQGK